MYSPGPTCSLALSTLEITGIICSQEYILKNIYKDADVVSLRVCNNAVQQI